MVVYPRDVPTGGIVGLRLTCSASVYCQALSSPRQAVIGFSSQTWDWNLTPLEAGPQFVTMTATTYDGTSSIVVDEEVIPVSLTVERGPWWAAADDWLHAVASFTATTAGLITTVGGAVVVIAGGAGWLRRKRGGKDQPEQNAPDEATADPDESSAGGKEPVSPADPASVNAPPTPRNEESADKPG
jgi:hypothetical protein